MIPIKLRVLQFRLNLISNFYLIRCVECNHFTTFFHSFSMLVYCAFYILKCNECAQTAFVMRLPFPTCDPMYVHCAVYTVCEWIFFYFFQQALHSSSCLVWISSSIHLQCMNWNRLIAKTIKAQEISPSLSALSLHAYSNERKMAFTSMSITLQFIIWFVLIYKVSQHRSNIEMICLR